MSLPLSHFLLPFAIACSTCHRLKAETNTLSLPGLQKGANSELPYLPAKMHVCHYDRHIFKSGLGKSVTFQGQDVSLLMAFY